jgi:DNA-binding transcriptional regulator YiaG
MATLAKAGKKCKLDLAKRRGFGQNFLAIVAILSKTCQTCDMNYTNVMPPKSFKLRLNGAAVQVIRELTGLNKTAFAARTEMSLGYLSRLESGARQPSAENLRKIASALRVPVEAITYPDFTAKK